VWLAGSSSVAAIEWGQVLFWVALAAAALMLAVAAVAALSAALALPIWLIAALSAFVRTRPAGSMPTGREI
jgi:hypothetical protein